MDELERAIKDAVSELLLQSAAAGESEGIIDDDEAEMVRDTARRLTSAFDKYKAAMR